MVFESIIDFIKSTAEDKDISVVFKTKRDDIDLSNGLEHIYLGDEWIYIGKSHNHSYPNLGIAQHNTKEILVRKDEIVEIVVTQKKEEKL